MLVLPYVSEAITSLCHFGLTLKNKLKSIKTFCLESLWQLKEAIVLHSHQIWEYAKPKLNKLSQAGLAILTAASTFKMSVQFAPIVLSMLTVLAAAPLFSFVLPQFLFAPSFLLPTLLGISIFAGYYKYNELVLRAKLDAQIIEDQKEITALKTHLTEDKLTLATLEATCKTLYEKVEKLETALLFSPPLHDTPAPIPMPALPKSDQNDHSRLLAAH